MTIFLWSHGFFSKMYLIHLTYFSRRDVNILKELTEGWSFVAMELSEKYIFF